ncbi:nucleolar protein dao-5-like [Salvia splendens]|uniref:nucleolar protein dao-5-like n=1 Tax=Salvia splendens TaxID=180675 RepID=UPI001C262F75|nr:nucleolar protein dao-5-like [Salvia splendens]
MQAFAMFAMGQTMPAGPTTTVTQPEAVETPPTAVPELVPEAATIIPEETTSAQDTVPVITTKPEDDAVPRCSSTNPCGDSRSRDRSGRGTELLAVSEPRLDSDSTRETPVLKDGEEGGALDSEDAQETVDAGLNMIVDLTEVPEEADSQLNLRGTRRGTRRSILDDIDESAQQKDKETLDLATAVSEQGDSPRPSGRESEEEGRRAMAKKRKGKQIASSSTEKAREISTDSPLPPPTKVPYAAEPESPARSSDSEEDQEADVLNFEPTEIWITKELLDDMRKFDDPKRAAIYKEKSAEGKGDSPRPSGRESEEEGRRAMAKKRKGKQIASSSTEKAREISTDSPLPPPTKVPYAAEPESPARSSDSEEDQEADVLNFEPTEIWITKELLDDMRKFDDPKRAAIYKEKSAEGKVAKSGKI